MPRKIDTMWINWHSIKKSFHKEDCVAYNYCQFKCVIQLNKLKVHFKKCQLYLHTQSSQNRTSSSTSYQPPVVLHRVISSEKNFFDAQATPAIFEGGMPLNTFDKHLNPAIYELVTNLNKRWKPLQR